MSLTDVSIPLEKCPKTLSAEHLARYAEDGYLAFNSFLSPAEVDAFNAGLHEMVGSLVARVRSGELQPKRGGWEGMKNYSGWAIDEKDGLGILLEPEVELDFRTATVEQVENSFRKLSSTTKGHPLFKGMSEDPRLIGMLEALLGPKPIYYGDMALCKPARIGTDKPWHQDSAYFPYEPFGHGVGVWIALDDAELENGCMQVLRGAHKMGPKKHVHLTDCTIQPGRVDVSEATPIEMRAGGIMLFSPLLPHFTPPNRSDKRRRAFQLFYRAGYTKMITQEEHSKNFLEADGTPATCSAASVEKAKSGK
jgi:phytanoyl-CoA hydroxylase